MGKGKKFKSFTEETAQELTAIKATIRETQRQQGQQLLATFASEERVKEITEKCLKQLKGSAGNTLKDFSKALTKHETATNESLRNTRKRVEDISSRVSGRVNSLEEFQITQLASKVETLTNRINELEQLVMMGRAKPKKSKKSVVIDPNEGKPISFISEDNVIVPPPGSQNPIDDPITAELKALEQFCNEKKKQGDAERAKVRELPE